MMFYFIDCRIKNIAKLHDNSQTDELLWIKMGNNMSFVGVLSAWSYLQKGNRSRFGVIYVMCGSHEMLVETDKLCHFVNGRMCAGGVFSPHRQVTGSSAFDYKQIFVSCYTLSGIKMCIFWA